ncbi:hypothetical protein [Denitromonas halophila]|uniref:Uncharacterized protein n=1 Tax=Denitromonas halophila TaxID=1629404 RepID=A0A557R1I0_9RHOO|nr:hypothetical protein [Denitromonas halophila]TVO59011.1 hypothetical protein FHP91_04990 [Denitromonas halophila]
MSGLFRRLARHATGQPVATVHAMARLPFQAPPPVVPMDDGAGALLAPGDTTDSPAGRVSAVATGDRTAPPRHDAPRRPAVPTRTPADVRTVADSSEPTEAQRRVPAPTHAPQTAGRLPDPPPAAQSTPVRQPPHLAGAGDDVWSAPSVSPERLLDRTAPATLTTSATRGASPHRAEGSTSPGNSTPDALPEPLLPAHAGSVAPRTTEPARSTPVAAEPTEVHVHIGRIDVTAVQAPAPPRRPARSAQAPMSLDAYLAKRQRSPS